MTDALKFPSGATMALVAVLLSSAPALAQQQASPSPPMSAPAAPAQPVQRHQTMMSQATGAGTPASEAMKQAMQKMQQSMGSVPAGGSADQEFVAMMIPHHQGAIDMARVELKYGKDATLRRLARNIVAAQQKEIKEMRSWQAQHPVAR